MWRGRGGQTPSRRLCAVVSSTSCRGTGNIISPDDASTGLCMGQAAWFLTRITCSRATWLFVDWEGLFPIGVLEIAVSSRARALELQRLPAKRRCKIVRVRRLPQACPPHLLGASPRFPELAACYGKGYLQAESCSLHLNFGIGGLVWLYVRRKQPPLRGTRSRP